MSTTNHQALSLLQQAFDALEVKAHDMRQNGVTYKTKHF